MKNQRINVAALLLVVQCGLALLAALGLSAYARFANAIELLRGFEVLAFGAPIMLLLLSAGVVKGWRLARIGVYVWEVLTILGPAFSVLASAGSALTLTVGLTGFGLPAAVVFLTKTSESQDSLDLRDSLTAGLLVVTGLIHLALAPRPPQRTTQTRRSLRPRRPRVHHRSDSRRTRHDLVARPHHRPFTSHHRRLSAGRHHRQRVG